MKKLNISILLIITIISGLKAKNLDSLEIMAYVEFKKNNFKSAADLFSELLKDKQGTTEYIYKQAECFYFLNDIENAKKLFLEANKNDKALASLYLTKIYILEENYDEAFNLLEEHLNSKYRLAQSKIKLDTDLKKLQSFDRWNNLWKNDYYTSRDELINEVNYLKKYRKYEEALDLLNEQFNKGCKSYKLFALKGDILFDMEQYHLAINEYSQAIKSTKRFPEYFIKRAESYFNLQELQKAENDYLYIIDKNPAEVQYYRRLAQIALKQKHYSKANNYMNNYLKYYSDDTDALFEFGTIYYESGSYFNALKYYNKVLKLNQDNEDYYIARGKTYLKTNTWKFAENDFSMALDLNPNNSNIYLNRGIARQKQGKIKEACYDWEKSATLGNKQAVVYLSDYCEN